MSKAGGPGGLPQAGIKHSYVEGHPACRFKLEMEGCQEVVDETSFFNKESQEVMDYLCY